jgi:hypothetical protein
MTNTTQPAANSPEANATGMRSEIGHKWPKLSATEIAAFKSKDDLVALVQSKCKRPLRAAADIPCFDWRAG